MDQRDLVIVAIVDAKEAFHVALLQCNEVSGLTFQAAIATTTVAWLRHVKRLREQEALRLPYRRLRRPVGLDGLIWRHDALIALEDFALKHDVHPAGEVGFHEALIVLFKFSQHVSMRLQTVFCPLHDLPNDEVFVDEQEEEAFEEGVQAEESIKRYSDKDLCQELAEELRLIKCMLVNLRELLQQLLVSSTFRHGIFPKHFCNFLG